MPFFCPAAKFVTLEYPHRLLTSDSRFRPFGKPDGTDTPAPATITSFSAFQASTSFSGMSIPPKSISLNMAEY